MGLALPYTQRLSTGRLEYRRDYPKRLQPFALAAVGRRNFRRTLGHGRLSDPAIRAAYHEAHADAERELALAHREATGTFDTLDAADIRSILDFYLNASFADDEASRDEFSADEIAAALAQSLDADDAGAGVSPSDEQDDTGFDTRMEGLTAHLSAVRRDHARGKLAANIAPDALFLAAERGYRVDPKSTGFRDLCAGLTKARIALLEGMLQRAAGVVVPTPPPPAPPRVAASSAEPDAARGQPPARTVAALIEAYSADKDAGWSPSTRSAYKPVFRLLRDCIGSERGVASITREDGRALFETVKALPAGMGKVKALAGLNVPNAIAKGRELGLATLGPKSINDSYLALLKALFGWAVNEQWLPANPMTGLSVADPVDPADKRAPFTAAQLQAIFGSAPWSPRDDAPDGRPERFWLPPLALWTGMRRSEIAGLAVADVEEREGVVVIIVRPNAARSLKTGNAGRIMPVHPELLRMGFASFVAAQRSAGAAYLFPGEAASKGKVGDAVGDWFGRHLGKLGVAGVRLGLHSFRHNFEDRLREADLHDVPIGAYLAGRAGGSVAGAYGSGYSVAKLADALGKVSYPGLDLERLHRADDEKTGHPTAPDTANSDGAAGVRGRRA